MPIFFYPPKKNLYKNQERNLKFKLNPTKYFDTNKETINPELFGAFETTEEVGTLLVVVVIVEVRFKFYKVLPQFFIYLTSSFLRLAMTSTKTYPPGHEPCTKPDDPRCKPKTADPTVVSTTEENEIITDPPKPKKTTTSQSQLGSSQKKSTITQFKTYTTTETLYFPGYTTYTSSTGTDGELTTYATYIPPSTVVVIKKVTSATVEEIQESNPVSAGHLDLELSVYNLYSIATSLFVISVTMLYLIVA
ncbi:10881_t:CDS:2 [Entrophospora sp. SA101]|nr:10881_t:CDS:2 [Entrophospora sp. SA101]